jgi:hypothetical protein
MERMRLTGRAKKREVGGEREERESAVERGEDREGERNRWSRREGASWVGERVRAL